jgi:hypothetical protein
MKKIAIASIITVFLACTCAFVVGTVSAQGGWEKTLTLPSGEKVLDMRGEWDVLVELAERYKWFGKPVPNIYLITQDGNTFSAVQQIEGKLLPKGTEKLKGVLDRDGFKEVQLYAHRPHQTPQFAWVPVTWKISENGNTMVFVHEGQSTITLTRR